jgi:CBS domain-containing protein
MSLLQSRGVAIHGIQQTESVEAAAAAFIDKKISALVVYEGEQLTGIFTKNDLVRCCARHPDGVPKLRISEVSKTSLYTTTPDADLDDVMEVMVKKGFRHVPVLDAGRAVGMVTSQDILIHQNEILQVEREELLRYIQGSY